MLQITFIIFLIGSRNGVDEHSILGYGDSSLYYYRSKFRYDAMVSERRTSTNYRATRHHTPDERRPQYLLMLNSINGSYIFLIYDLKTSREAPYIDFRAFLKF